MFDAILEHVKLISLHVSSCNSLLLHVPGLELQAYKSS